MRGQRPARHRHRIRTAHWLETLWLLSPAKRWPCDCLCRPMPCLKLNDGIAQRCDLCLKLIGRRRARVFLARRHHPLSNPLVVFLGSRSTNPRKIPESVEKMFQKPTSIKVIVRQCPAKCPNHVAANADTKSHGAISTQALANASVVGPAGTDINAKTMDTAVFVEGAQMLNVREIALVQKICPNLGLMPRSKPRSCVNAT